MELCDGGATSDIYCDLDRPFSEPELSLVCRDTLRGLNYMLTVGYLHRDIKGANILLKKDGSVKIVDFGVSGRISPNNPTRITFIGTPYWMAPEVIESRGAPAPYDFKADVWSLGITLLELAHGEPPLADISPMKALFQIPYRPPPTLKEPGKWSNNFADFLSKCLQINPAQRWSYEQLLNHPWLSIVPANYDILKTMVADYLEAKRLYEEQGSSSSSASSSSCSARSASSSSSSSSSSSYSSYSSSSSSYSSYSEDNKNVSNDSLKGKQQVQQQQQQQQKPQIQQKQVQSKQQLKQQQSKDVIPPPSIPPPPLRTSGRTAGATDSIYIPPPPLPAKHSEYIPPPPMPPPPLSPPPPAQSTTSTTTSSKTSSKGPQKPQQQQQTTSGQNKQRPVGSKTMHKGPARRSYEEKQNKDRLMVKRQLAEIQAMNKQNKKDMDALVAKMTDQRSRSTKAMRDKLMKDIARKTRDDEALFRRSTNMSSISSSNVNVTSSPIISSKNSVIHPIPIADVLFELSTSINSVPVPNTVVAPVVTTSSSTTATNTNTTTTAAGTTTTPSGSSSPPSAVPTSTVSNGNNNNNNNSDTQTLTLSSTTSSSSSSSSTVVAPAIALSASTSAAAATTTISSPSIVATSAPPAPTSSSTTINASTGPASSASATSASVTLDISTSIGTSTSNNNSVSTNVNSNKMWARSEVTKLEQQVTKAAGVKLDQRLHEMKETEKRLQKLDGYKALPKKLQNQVKAWEKQLRQHETDASALASEHEIAFMRLVGDQKRRNDQLDEAHAQAGARLTLLHQQESNTIEILRNRKEELFAFEKSQELEILRREQDSEMAMIKAKHALQDKQYTARVALENNQLQTQHSIEVQERVKELHMQQKARLKALALAHKQAEKAADNSIAAAAATANNSNATPAAAAATATTGDDTNNGAAAGSTSAPQQPQGAPVPAIDKKVLRAEQKAEEDELRAEMRQEESKLCETIALEQIPEIGALNRIHEEQLGGVRNSQIAEIKELAARHIAEEKALNEVLARKHEDMAFKQFKDKNVFFSKQQEEVAALHFKLKYEKEMFHESLRTEELELLRTQYEAEKAAIDQRSTQVETALSELKAILSKASTSATPAMIEFSTQLDVEAAALREKAARDKQALDEKYAAQIAHVDATAQKIVAISNEHYNALFASMASQQEKDLLMLKGELRILIADHHTENPPQIDFPQHSPFYVRINSPIVVSRHTHSNSATTSNIVTIPRNNNVSSSRKAAKSASPVPPNGGDGILPPPLPPSDKVDIPITISNSNADAKSEAKDVKDDDIKDDIVVKDNNKANIPIPTAAVSPSTISASPNNSSSTGSKLKWRRSIEIGAVPPISIPKSCSSERNSGSSTPLAKVSDVHALPPPPPPPLSSESIASLSSASGDSDLPLPSNGPSSEPNELASRKSKSSIDLRNHSPLSLDSSDPIIPKPSLPSDDALPSPPALVTNNEDNSIDKSDINNDTDTINVDTLDLPPPPSVPAPDPPSSSSSSSSSTQ